MKRIKRFGVYQTAKAIAIIYFIIIAVIMVPFGLFSLSFDNEAFSRFPLGGGAFFMLLPFLYGFVIFIMTAIGCAVYNLISRWTGGIELEFETVGEDEVNTVVDPQGNVNTENFL